MSTVSGIDPGLSSGGIVILQGDRIDVEILESISMVEKPSARKAAIEESKSIVESMNGWGDREFTAAIIRSMNWRDKFVEVLKELQKNYKIDAFAIESFVDQRSRAREEKQRLLKNRWHTPLLMGQIAQILEENDINVRNNKLYYQNAGIVIRQWSNVIGELKSRTKNKKKPYQDLIYPGDKYITNDHERKALAHALALIMRL